MRQFILSIIAVVILSACSQVQFDPVEYDRLVYINRNAEVGRTQCGTKDVVTTITIIGELIEQQDIYAAHRPNRSWLSRSSHRLSDTFDGLKKRYKDKSPSATYCQEKFEMISNETMTMINGEGKL